MKNFVRRPFARSLGMAGLALFALALPAAAANQVPFTATGTVVITGVTNLPGGLTTGTYTVTGGTGSFANATGSGIIVSEIDLCANTATGTYTGTISQPNSN